MISSIKDERGQEREGGRGRRGGERKEMGRGQGERGARVRETGGEGRRGTKREWREERVRRMTGKL
jgi:hypothetical protein